MLPTLASDAAPKMARKPKNQVTAAYVIFLVGAGAVYHFIAKGEFSAILTMAVIFQCLAMALLGMHILAKGNVSGVSARALTLEAISFACRLSSTTWLNGYLPVDASGDMIYQAVDVCSLLVVLWLLYHILVEQRNSYDKESDTLPTLPMVVGAFILAAILHADMNSRPFFDTLWMMGLFVGVVAVLPQLWLTSKSGGVIEACEGHFIAMMAVSRVLSGTFMWHARFDITCEPYVQGVNHAVWAILVAHAAHLLLLGDFAYYYGKAIVSNGLGASIDLRDNLEIV
jgi:hypothetical protein